jgi:protein-S-isoprenylcysteine O-methyltransferase Ste14
MPLPHRVLRRRAWWGLAQLAAAIALAVLLPGGLQYREGWTFLLLFVACSAAINQHILRHDPALLERRLAAGPRAEQRPLQKVIQALASLCFVGTMLLSAFDHRNGWSQVPLPLALFGDLLVGLGFLAVLRVFRENTFASAVIEVGAEQRLIDSGPYALVRHPMYASALVLFIGIPLALVWRLRDEETLLCERLPGYDAYRRRTPYRLLPHIW